MHKIITGLLSFTLFSLCTEICFSDQGMLYKAKKNGKNVEFVKSQIDEMQQQQIDQLQKYIFNLQDVKNKPHAVTTFQTDELVEQIKMLRKEMEGVKKDIQSLKYKLEKSSRGFDSKINNIKSQIDEQNNNKQILNLIDSELDVSNNLESNDSRARDYIDSEQFEKDQDEYKKVLSLVNKKDYNLALLELKNFIKTHPDSILNSNAFFYLGEIYYERNNYTVAAINYLKGFQADKNGSRTLSNLTMLAKCLSRIGNYDKSCKVVNYTEYKYSEIPTSIKRTLNNIKQSSKCEQTYVYG
ncbi:hypothetical protein [Rickettsiales endosymbiont of Trichoplax sp. H2]|uniref:hypothetical protein n=1 Tax=Rickettsiales endosymbiont of Trichoplax sp. H2 TaxID=2021221 RepID=UPI0012B24672|nr:hypothetical protein [Rickettsiales endosymbiont of Trichoplax sp. H2]